MTYNIFGGTLNLAQQQLHKWAKASKVLNFSTIQNITFASN